MTSIRVGELSGRGAEPESRGTAGIDVDAIPMEWKRRQRVLPPVGCDVWARFVI